MLCIPLALRLAQQPPVTAQDYGGNWRLWLRVDGTHAQDTLGDAIAPAGDLDGDGVPDFIVGATNNGSGFPGRALVVSGVSGQTLFELIGSSPGDFFGNAVGSAGDIDGDGCPDILVGAPFDDAGGLPETGSAFVYSGADGRVLLHLTGVERSEEFGTWVRGLADLNQDGTDDFYVESLNSDTFWVDGGSARVFSGHTGTLLYELGGLGPFPGRSGAPLGDVNGDNYPDFVLSDLGINSRGALTVYSGFGGSILYRVEGQQSGDNLGFSLDAVGDLDGDGIQDFIAGAPQDASRPGKALVFSGINGAVLFELAGKTRAERFGDACAGPGDVDGDGFPDLLVSAPCDFACPIYGRVELYSGYDASLISAWYGECNVIRVFGDELSSVGDLNGDGLADWLTGTVGVSANGFNSGAAFAYVLDSYLRADTRELSAAAGGTVTFTLDFPDSEGGLGYWLLMSTDERGRVQAGQVSVPLSDSRVLRRMLHRPPTLFPPMSGTLDALGDAVVAITVPPGKAVPWLGRSLRFAAVSLDALGRPRLSSAGLRFAIVP